MPVTARVLSDAARRTSGPLRDLIRSKAGHDKGLADRIRWYLDGFRDVDNGISGWIQSYQLLRTQPRPGGGLLTTPIGVAVHDARDAWFSQFHAARANSSYLGYFRLPVPHGVDPDDLLRRQLRGLPYYRPQAEWIPSPFGPAALQGRPPVQIVIHHTEDGFETEIMKEPRRAVLSRTLPDAGYQTRFVDAEDLARLLWQDEDLLDALDPGRDIFLVACSVGQHEAQWIANLFNRTTHFSTGVIFPVSPTPLVGAVSDSSRLPFSVTDDVREAFNSSLDSAPPELRAVAKARGWSAFAVFADAGSRVPSIQTVTPP